MRHIFHSYENSRGDNFNAYWVHTVTFGGQSMEKPVFIQDKSGTNSSIPGDENLYCRGSEIRSENLALAVCNSWRLLRLRTYTQLRNIKCRSCRRQKLCDPFSIQWATYKDQHKSVPSKHTIVLPSNQYSENTINGLGWRRPTVYSQDDVVLGRAW